MAGICRSAMLARLRWSSNSVRTASSWKAKPRTVHLTTSPNSSHAMRRPDEPDTLRVGLALVDPLFFDSSLFEELDRADIRATFFVRPEVLIIDSIRWKFVRLAGHELGNGCLLGVTDDG